MMPQEFEFDVFVSYSSKDQAVVLDLAQRLRDAGVRVWLDLWEIALTDRLLGKAAAKIEYGLVHSRLLLLCISKHALGADWVQLESQSVRFRDPLNQERRVIPVRLDDAEVQGSLAQFRALDWRGKTEAAFAQLCSLCLVQPAPPSDQVKLPAVNAVIKLPREGVSFGAAFSADGHLMLRGGQDGMLELWQMPKQQCLQVFKGHKKSIRTVALSADGQYAVSGMD